MYVKAPFFIVAMAFAVLANGLAFLMLGRMRSLGQQVSFWRTHRDWTLYREYWRIAPARNWSRAPIVIGILSFLLAACFLWFSVAGVPVTR